MITRLRHTLCILFRSKLSLTSRLGVYETSTAIVSLISVLLCLEAQARTDHGADDERDAAEEVDAALQLVVLVHVGRHVAALSLPPSSLDLHQIAAHVQTDRDRPAAPEKLETCFLLLLSLTTWNYRLRCDCPAKTCSIFIYSPIVHTWSPILIHSKRVRKD